MIYFQTQRVMASQRNRIWRNSIPMTESIPVTTWPAASMEFHAECRSSPNSWFQRIPNPVKIQFAIPRHVNRFSKRI